MSVSGRGHYRSVPSSARDTRSTGHTAQGLVGERLRGFEPRKRERACHIHPHRVVLQHGLVHKGLIRQGREHAGLEPITRGRAEAGAARQRHPDRRTSPDGEQVSQIAAARGPIGVDLSQARGAGIAPDHAL